MLGERFGHYQIEGQIGAGGMGVVYRAQDESLGRLVALKLVGERYVADPRARERLVAEARNASSLNHPNICTIYEVGEADGHTYIAMEYVEGRSLTGMVLGQGLAPETLLRYAVQIADALAHAHQRGVLHRDLKSANVMITSEGRAKVLDFGLATRAREQEIEEATRSRMSLAEAATVAGTLHYMAPEVLRGQPADERSDIWSLGVMLYEMAAGSLPFTGATTYELSSAILREALPAMPTTAGAGLRAVVQRCLKREPGERYQKASEVRAALETLESSTEVAVPVRVAEPTRRVQRWVIVGGAALLAIGTLVAVLRESATKLSSPSTRNVDSPAGKQLSTGGRPSVNPEANEYFEQAMVFVLHTSDFERSRHLLERALQADPHFAEARGWYGFMEMLVVDGGMSNDLKWLYKGEEDARRALKDDPDCAVAHSSLAMAYYYQARIDLMRAELDTALRINPRDQNAIVWLGGYHLWAGNYAACADAMKEALDRDPAYYVARTFYGDCLRYRGDVEGDIREQRNVLEQDPTTIYAVQNLCRAYVDAGKLNEARKLLDSRKPEERANYLVRLCSAQLLALEGKRAAALKEMDSELQRYTEVNPYWTSYTAEFYAVLGDQDKALDWLDRAVRSGDQRDEWFRKDPLLAKVRDHPRFQQILDSIAYRRKQQATTGSAKR